MKYSKGDFTLVPSRQARIGMPANQQVVYMWLCEHSDDNMQSFPSRKVLAYECGMSVRTLDRSLEALVNGGYVAKSARHSNNQQSSNLYEVAIVARGDKSAPPAAKKRGRGVNMASLGATNLHGGGDKIDTQNYTQLTQPNNNHSTTNVVGDEAPVYGKPEINELFEYWGHKTGVAIQGRRQANRNACSNLYKKYGADKLKQLIDGVALAQADRFAPRIADFTDLQAKLNQLLTWGKAKQNNQKGTIKV
jgi:hypothetical protein